MIVTRDSFLAPIRAPLSLAAGVSERFKRIVSLFSKIVSFITRNCIVTSSGPPGVNNACPVSV